MSFIELKKRIDHLESRGTTKEKRLVSNLPDDLKKDLEDMQRRQKGLTLAECVNSLTPYDIKVCNRLAVFLADEHNRQIEQQPITN